MTASGIPEPWNSIIGYTALGLLLLIVVVGILAAAAAVYYRPGGEWDRREYDKLDEER